MNRGNGTTHTTIAYFLAFLALLAVVIRGLETFLLAGAFLAAAFLAGASSESVNMSSTVVQLIVSLWLLRKVFVLASVKI